MEEMVGSTVAHYKVLQRLGGGAMGDVYRAEDTRLGRVVALKFLPAAWCCDPGRVRRFKREARAVSALDHPNICTMHAIEETGDDRIFIVMTHYEGKTIRERIEDGSLPLHEAIDTAIHIAGGLARAHQRGIVHRGQADRR
jgi:serine/threonine protein kinase